MPLIKPLARYFSIPSRDVGGLHLRNVALNCSPCSLSCTQLPRAVIHSPALTLARAPTTVTSSRCPFTFTRSTANPVSSLWKVTRSINPENPSWGGDDGGVFTLQSVSMEARPCHSRSRHFLKLAGLTETFRSQIGLSTLKTSALIVYPAKCSMKRKNPIGAKPSLLVSFQIFPDQRTHIFAKIHGKRSSFSLRLQMQRRRQGNRNPKRNPSWAPGRFCFFGPVNTTIVLLHTLYVYCTYCGRATLEPPYEAFRTARHPQPLSSHQTRPGPN